jgi:D-methionine transport system substrate-binding protein
MLRKNLLSVASSVLFLSVLAAGASTAPATALAGQSVILKVGVTAGPHEQIMREVAAFLARENIILDIRVFTDYKIPNQALQSKELDVNSFQHQPYLDRENKERGFKLVSVAKTVTFPMGVYAQNVKKLEQLKEGARVAIPNDPTNGGRALLLLQTAGLIKLRPDAGILASPQDIVENPKKLKFEALDAAVLPRVLSDVDAAAINTNYALESGLNPVKDGIYIEQDSPYVNIIAVRAEDHERPEVRKLVGVYQSAEIRKFIADKFQGAVVPGW